MAWFLKGQATAYSDLIYRQFTEGATPVVPQVWQLEMINAILVAARRGKITRSDAELAIGRVIDSGGPVDTHSSIRRVAEIARTYSVSSYGAAYLELVERLSLPLATKDQAMKGAAEAMGIRVFG